MSDNKKFTFDADGNVTAMYAVKGAYMKFESIANTTFVTEAGTFTSGGTGIVEVEATKAGKSKTEFSVYSDQDGDGRFIESFELDVVNTALFRAENYKFDLAGEEVTQAYELGKRGWKIDYADADESYSVLSVDGDTFIVKTEAEYVGAEFDIYVDRDGDGLWSKIAEGETTGDFLHADGSVDLVGIVNAGLLAPADVVTV